MESSFKEAFKELMMDQLGDELPQSVLERFEQMNHPMEAIWAAQDLKDTGNNMFKANDFPHAVAMYERALQFLCVGMPTCSQDAELMSELAVTLNSNLAACWLRMEQYDIAQHHCDLAMKFDTYNVKVRYRTALSFLHRRLVEKARKDLEIALKFEPKNKVVLNELKKLEDEYGPSKERLGVIQTTTANQKVFDTLRNHSRLKGVESNKTKSSLDNQKTKLFKVQKAPPLNDGLRKEVEVEKGKGTLEDFEIEGPIKSKESQQLKMCLPSRIEVLEDVGSKINDMDIDKFSCITSNTKGDLEEVASTMVESSVTADSVKVSVGGGERVSDMDIITFSCSKRPGMYLRLSREAYRRILEGKHVSYSCKLRHSVLNVSRAFTSKSKDMSMEQMGGHAEGVEPSGNNSPSTGSMQGKMKIEYEYEDDASESRASRTSKVDDNAENSSVTQEAGIFFFKAIPQSSKRKRMCQSDQISSNKRGSKKNPTEFSYIGKHRNHKSFTTKVVSFCRNPKEASSARKRNVGHLHNSDKIYAKKQCLGREQRALLSSYSLLNGCTSAFGGYLGGQANK